MTWWNKNIYAGQLKYARAKAVTGWNIALDWNFGPNMYTDFYNGNCPVGMECGCQYCTPFIFVSSHPTPPLLTIVFPLGGRAGRQLHQEG